MIPKVALCVPLSPVHHTCSVANHEWARDVHLLCLCEFIGMGVHAKIVRNTIIIHTPNFEGLHVHAGTCVYPHTCVKFILSCIICGRKP